LGACAWYRDPFELPRPIADDRLDRSYERERGRHGSGKCPEHELRRV